MFVSAVIAYCIESAGPIIPISFPLSFNLHPVICSMVSFVFPFVPITLDLTTERFFLLVKSFILIISNKKFSSFRIEAVFAENPRSIASNTRVASYSSNGEPSIVTVPFVICILRLNVLSRNFFSLLISAILFVLIISIY